MKPSITLTMNVNGRARRVRVPPMKRLLDVLREDCGLTGSKEGCGEGECGACTVMLDGRPVNACLVPAVHADGAKVVTVEGLAKGERLSALQTTFVEMGGSQCGMCTPGMLVAAVAVLRDAKGRVPTDHEVRNGLSGTLCRCTGYQKIVDAVIAAAVPAKAKVTPRRAAKSSVRAAKAPASGAKAKVAPRHAAKPAPKRSAKKQRARS